MIHNYCQKLHKYFIDILFLKSKLDGVDYDRYLEIKKEIQDLIKQINIAIWDHYDPNNLKKVERIERYRVLTEYKLKNEELIFNLQALPDNTIIATSEYNYLYRFKDNQTVEKKNLRPSGGVECLQCLPDGTLLTAAKKYNEYAVYKISQSDFNKQESLIDTKLTNIRGLRMVASGRIFLYAMNGTFEVWDYNSKINKYQLTSSVDLKNGDDVKAFDIFADGSVVCNSKEKKLAVWQEKDNKFSIIDSFWKYYPQSDNPKITSLKIINDNEIVSGAANGDIVVWERDKNNLFVERQSWQDSGNASINCLQALPDGRLVSGSSSGYIRFWEKLDNKTYNTKPAQSIEFPWGPVVKFQVLEDGRIVAGGGLGVVVFGGRKMGKYI